jgi:hypothetical protein
MIKLEIKAWDHNKAWTDWSGQAKRQFVNRMRELSNVDNTEIKRLARKVLDKEKMEFTLDRISETEKAASIRHLLESLGATVEVKNEP